MSPRLQTFGVTRALAIALAGIWISAGCTVKFGSATGRQDGGADHDGSQTFDGATDSDGATNSDGGGACGDGNIEGIETCDDGNASGGDGCSAECQVEPGWVCSGEPSVCARTCGNGAVDWAEGCDDGNLDGGDGCSSNCQVEPGWACTSAPSTCTPICGDGLIVGNEACDDGNNANDDGCSNCRVEDFHACAGEPSVCTCVVFVAVDAITSTRDGGSWTRALETVQEGIDLAETMGNCEVWVAGGTYPIYQSNMEDTLTLSDGVGVYGGFAGNETARSQRNWAANPTVLDGSSPSVDQGVSHVVTANGVQGATLNGFTVTGAGNGATVDGGGLTAYNAELTVANCVFLLNQARGGAGMYLEDSDTLVSDCRFENNDASYGTADSQDGGGIAVLRGTIGVEQCAFLENQADREGGGLSIVDAASAAVSDCLFELNHADRQGGALFVGNATVSVDRCLFLENTADYGGGMENQQGDVTLTSSVFAANQAIEGGGTSTFYQAQTTLINCTLVGNTATGGQATGGGVLSHTTSSSEAVNSIVWTNQPDQFNTFNGSTNTVTYCAVMGGHTGAGNIGGDPLFADPTNFDFHLSSGSPCIDAANGDRAPGTDIEDAPRADDPNTPNTGTGTPPYADMGAYEF